MSDKYEAYIIWEKENSQKKLVISSREESMDKEDNKFSYRIIGYGIATTGAIVSILGSIASEGSVLVVTTGVIFAMFGLFIAIRNTKKNKETT